MFKLIARKSTVLDEAHAFASDNIGHVEPGSPALGKMIPAHIKFPCLIDWFVNFDYRSREMLDYNICYKSDAKCLVYPRTNKPNHLYQLILKSDTDLGKKIKRSGGLPTLWKKSTVILDDNFDEVMAGRGSSDEPFFVKVRMVRRDDSNRSCLNYLRVSAVNLAMAKELVYYTKNNRITFTRFTRLSGSGTSIGTGKATITAGAVQNMVDITLPEAADIDELIDSIGNDE